MARISDTERDARRKGKKIAVHRSTACEGVVNLFDVRLTDKDTFTAEFLGAWYEAETIAELKKVLDEEVAKQGPTSWEYFIEIDDVDFDDTKDRPYYWQARERIKIEMDYRVVKLSNVITPSGREPFRGGYREEVEPYRLRKAVYIEKDGMRDADDQKKVSTGTLLRTTILPYTAERWAALEGIAAAARELGRRMAQMLNGEKAVAFLDDQARLQVLALPPAPPPVADKPKKAVRR